MNPALALLLTIGIAGLIFILWLTVAGLRQQWIEHTLKRPEQQPEPTLSLRVDRRSNFTDTLFRVALVPSKKNDTLAPFNAGQYLTLLIPQPGKKNKIRRSYSLACWQAKPSKYELAIKREESGKGSSWLFDFLQEGTIVEAVRPKGSFILNAHDREIILVAGGIGITPLRSMIHFLQSFPQHPSVKLFLASRFETGLCYHEEFEELQKRESWFQYFPILSQPTSSWTGLSGRLTGALLHKNLVNPALCDFYLCAGIEMMDTIMNGLLEKGINQSQFHFENFAVSSGNVADGSFTINIQGYGDVVYERDANVFQCLENQDYPIQGDCRVGQCGLCKMKLKKGNVRWLTEPEAACSENEFLPCICQPTENIEIARV
jgi:ferredoxin-NADP reductase